MNEKEMQNFLLDLICEAADLEDLQHVGTFEGMSVMTNDAGLVLQMADGSDFYITITKQ